MFAPCGNFHILWMHFCSHMTRSWSLSAGIELYCIFQEAVKIESTWWALVDIPQQNRAETFGSYVLRVCNTIDSVRIPLTSEANSFRESERDKDARVEKVNGESATKRQCERLVRQALMHHTLGKITQKVHYLKNMFFESCNF